MPTNPPCPLATPATIARLQARAALRQAGGIERIEQVRPVRGIDAGAVVGDLDPAEQLVRILQVVQLHVEAQLARSAPGRVRAVTASVTLCRAAWVALRSRFCTARSSWPRFASTFGAAAPGNCVRAIRIAARAQGARHRQHFVDQLDQIDAAARRVALAGRQQDLLRHVHAALGRALQLREFGLAGAAGRHALGGASRRRRGSCPARC